jgi:ribosomal protein S4
MQVERKAEKVPSWLKSGKTSGEVSAQPVWADIEGSIKEQLIVELYSR